MNIIELARQAGLVTSEHQPQGIYFDALERFAALVRAEAYQQGCEDMKRRMEKQMQQLEGQLAVVRNVQAKALAEKIPEWVDVDDYEEPVKHEVHQEPVAFSCNLCGLKSPHVHIDERVIMYSQPVDANAILETERKRHAFELSMQEELFADKAEAIRAEALEEAAKVCDDKHDYMCSRAAAAIRGLK